MAYARQREVKRITLSDPNYWIEVYTKVKYREKKAFEQAAQIEGVDGVVAADVLLLTMIADWNLDNEEGAKLPINQDSLDQLESEDAEKVLLDLSDLLIPDEEVKKKLLSESSPPSKPKAKSKPPTS